jgi:hypothetical protein
MLAGLSEGSKQIINFNWLLIIEVSNKQLIIHLSVITVGFDVEFLHRFNEYFLDIEVAFKIQGLNTVHQDLYKVGTCISQSEVLLGLHFVENIPYDRGNTFDVAS